MAFLERMGMDQFKTVLIVDDDTDLGKATADILEFHDFKVTRFISGHEALSWAEQHAPALALIDSQQDDLSGLDVIRGLKQRLPDIGCILVTGSASQPSSIDVHNNDIFAHIQKPYNPEQLLSIMQRAYDKRITEQAQKEYQALYQTFLDAAADMAFLKDQHFRYLLVNEGFAGFLGRPAGEIIGRSDFELIEPQSAQVSRQNDAKALSNGEVVVSIEYVRGSILETRKFPVRLLNGQVGVGGYIRDVTRVVKSEEAIQHYLSNLEVLFENGLLLSHLVDPRKISQRIMDLLVEHLHWNLAVIRLYDAEQDHFEVLGFNYQGLTPDQAEHELKRLQASISDRGKGLTGWAVEHRKVVRLGDLSSDPRYFDTYQGMKSGMYVPMLVGGQVKGVITVESDLPDAFSSTDERMLVTLAAQAGVAFENARLYNETRCRLDELDAISRVSSELRKARSRVEMLPVILNQTMLLLAADGAAFVFLDEATNEVVIELGVGALHSISNLRLPRERGIIGEVLRTGVYYLSQDIASDPVRVTPTPDLLLPKAMVFMPLMTQNRVIGVIVVGSQNTITPYHVNILIAIANMAANAIQRASLHEETLRYAAQLEQRVEERTMELRETNAALERASRLKDEFLASMSHELRTPLTGILNLSEVLQEQVYGTLNEKQLSSISIIEESGRHLLRLINDILDLTKIEAGQLDPEFETCQVDMVCQSSLQLTKGMAGKKRQQLSFSSAPPGIEIEADTRRLKQMLVNLLSNAVKFTPEHGRIGLDVRGDAEAGLVTFTVWDTGIGIAEEDFPRLFQPFSQLDASLSRQYNGTGLGLAIVQRLADLHGGSVSLESKLGQGSKFMIHLPWKVVPMNDDLKPTPELSRSRLNPTDRPGQSDRPHQGKILLVDDHDLNVKIYSEYLMLKGYHVIIASDGLQGLQAAREQRPDVILMDIQMPGKDGLTVIRELRSDENPTISQTPIIALTALTMPGDRERCLEAGANDYLSKPVSLNVLLRTIQTFLKPA